MCGVVALFSPDGGVSAQVLGRATAALRHRGPDGERTWTSRCGRAGLGHARLAINDPEAAQPIASEDERLRIAVNGEFYGFEAMRASLERRGHQFRTRSDSEIAVHLYEDHGAECLHSLRGQFAFVAWDEEKGEMFAARDRFGLKPLFYCEHAGTLLLASEAKALFAAGAPRGWDPQAVYHALHACPDERRSLFAGIRQVPPGHFLVASRGRLRLERYWDLPPSPRTGRGGRAGRLRRAEAEKAADSDSSASARCARVRERVEEAVRIRLVADVPVGCLLSGGLDSSSVLGVAAAASETPMAAFTVGFDDAAYDETGPAREMAEAAGADHHVVALRGADLADHFADAVWHAETLQYNAHGTARFLLARGVRRAGWTSVLAGEGADEAFFGYEFLRAAAQAGSGKRNWPRLALRLLRSSLRRRDGLAQASPWLARAAALAGAGPSLLGRLSTGVDHLRALCDPEFLRGFRGYDLYRAFYRRCDREAGLSAREPARRLLYLWLRSLFANYHLAADRLDMAHGVEVRLPFLDHVLFEHVNALPLDALTGGRSEKQLLRDAMRPYLPALARTRPKRPFWAPPAAGVPGTPLHGLVQDTLRSRAMASVPFLDRQAVLRLLDRASAIAPKDRPALDSLLVMLASVAVLQERYGL